MPHEPEPSQTFFRCGTKPYVRWWWLAGPFRAEDTRFQLDWVKANGFGGVELAWIWPRWYGAVDESSIPRWLSPEWSAIVCEAKRYADQIGIGCDFTFGSCWPFGGSCVTQKSASQTFNGLSQQRLNASWEEPLGRPLFVLNHLSRHALTSYANALLPALGPCLAGNRSGLFCDSLEVDTGRLWSPQLWDRFADEFGYRLETVCDFLDRCPDVRYDYRKFLATTMVHEFYEPYVEICHAHGSFARVQCHGSPTDLLTSYAAVDVPESESLLFEPTFSRIPASAAALSGKRVVSAETFTCIYGFITRHFTEPYRYWRREQAADLKLLADAVVANGVNQIVWHGMPYNPPGGKQEFYASVHVGPDASFADEIPKLNRYLETVCGLMQRGHTESQLAIYLPNEDNWMLDRLPKERCTPGASHWWEMRYVVPPAETAPFQPLWISTPFLKRAEFREGRLHVGDQSFAALYVDVEWLDVDALTEISRIADAGFPIVLKRQPSQPGRKTSPDYQQRLQKVTQLSNVVDDLRKTAIKPIVTGDDLPWYWVRRASAERYFFFAHPTARDVRYPMPYSFSRCAQTESRHVTIDSESGPIRVELAYEPHQSILLRVTDRGDVESVDIAYHPPVPPDPDHANGDGAP